MAMSNTEADKILNHQYRTNTYAKPANRWIGLTVGGVEVTGTGYGRIQVACADASWTAPATEGGIRVIKNAAELTFPSPGGDWSAGSTIDGWAIYDASTAGNVLDSGSIASPFVVLNGNAAPKIAANALVIGLDN